MPEYWGKGYATESGKAVIEYGFEQMNLEIIYACTDIENVKSTHILNDKLGFSEKGTFIDDLDNATCFWFELEKGNFRNRENAN